MAESDTFKLFLTWSLLHLLQTLSTSWDWKTLHLTNEAVLSPQVSVTFPVPTRIPSRKSGPLTSGLGSFLRQKSKGACTQGQFLSIKKPMPITEITRHVPEQEGEQEVRGEKEGRERCPGLRSAL